MGCPTGEDHAVVLLVNIQDYNARSLEDASGHTS